MANLVTLTIDDKTVTVPAGTLIVNAAKEIGNDIPVFCYHPKMEPVGMCRMCLVDIGRPGMDRATRQPLLNPDGTPVIQFGPKLETACTTPVSEGMVVRTNSDKVQEARKDVIEFLLTSHPLDCPICDKGGECPLQNLTMAYGPGKSRFLYDQKIHLAKHYPLGELIFLDRERCIQCGRCVRFQKEVVDDPVIAFSQRGRSLEIITTSEPGFDSYFSGNTTDICPVGALTSTDFRFAARPWELKSVASICTQCPVGCNLTIDVRREAMANGRAVVKRIMPRQNEEVNEIWICDKGRFTYHFAESGDRLKTPLIRRNGELVKATWDEALDLVAQSLRSNSANLVTLAGGSLANEDLFNLRQFTLGLKGRLIQDSPMAGGEWTARVGLGAGSNLGALGKGSTIVVVASDLQEEAPIWFLRVKQAADRGAKLVVINARETKLDRYASAALRYAYGEEQTALAAFKPGAVVAEDARAAVDAVSAAENLVIFFGSDGLGIAETRSLAATCSNLLIIAGHAGKVNSGLVGVWQKANNQGAFDMGFEPTDDLAAAISAAGVLYVAGADPAGQSSALAQAVDSAKFVIVQELFLTETARRADVVFPVQSFIEREGTFTSGERRVQRFYPAVAAMPGARPDFAITAQLAQRMNLPIQGRVASLALLQIAETIPDYAGLTYPALSVSRPQHPIIGRSDLYYGGTSYENLQGMGVQLQPQIQTGHWQPAAQPESTPAAALQTPTAQSGEVWVVPVTRLYDQGATVTPSTLLQARMAKAELRMPTDLANSLGVAAHEQVNLELDGSLFPVKIVMDDCLPAGVATLPRDVGIPLNGRRIVKIQRIAEAAASLRGG